MAKNWRNLGFEAKFLTSFALSDERKMAFLAAKSFGAYSYAIRPGNGVGLLYTYYTPPDPHGATNMNWMDAGIPAPPSQPGWLAVGFPVIWSFPAHAEFRTTPWSFTPTPASVESSEQSLLRQSPPVMTTWFWLTTVTTLPTCTADNTIRYNPIRYDRWFALENWQASC